MGLSYALLLYQAFLSVKAYYKKSVLLEYLRRQRPSGVSDPFRSRIGLGADGQEFSYFFCLCSLSDVPAGCCPGTVFPGTCIFLGVNIEYVLGEASASPFLSPSFSPQGKK